MTTTSGPSAELENEMLEECLLGYRQAVKIADRARDLNKFLTGLHGEFPEVPKSEMGAEAKAEQMAQFVDRQLIGALEAFTELVDIADRAPAQALIWTRATAQELKEARDVLSGWRTTA